MTQLIKEEADIINRKKLVNSLHEIHKDLTPKELYDVVNVILDEIKYAVTFGDRIEIRGFGSFSRKIRQGEIRNPKTNKFMEVTRRVSMQFRPSRELLKSLNGKSE